MNTDLIRKQLLFAGLPEKDIAWLGQMAELVALKKGNLLMEEGTPGDALYLVVEGEFQVAKRSGNSEVALAMRGAGQMFGEMSLLEPGGLRTATVRAATPSRTIRYSAGYSASEAVVT